MRALQCIQQERMLVHVDGSENSEIPCEEGVVPDNENSEMTYEDGDYIRDITMKIKKRFLDYYQMI